MKSTRLYERTLSISEFAVAISVLGLVVLSACQRDSPPVSAPEHSERQAEIENLEPTAGCTDVEVYYTVLPKKVLVMGGRNGSVSDPNLEFRVGVRSAWNQPVAGAEVTIQWSYADYDYAVCSQTFPGMTYRFEAGVHKFTTLSDAEGWAKFRISGSSWNSQQVNCLFDDNNYRKAELYICGEEFDPHLDDREEAIHVATLDLDGGGVTVTDMQQMLLEIGCSPTYHGRADLDGIKPVGATDLHLFLKYMGTGGSLIGCF